MSKDIRILGECWIWQPWKVYAWRKKLGNRLGWCHSTWLNGQLVSQYIEMVKVKPWFHKKLLKHELTHWKINETSPSREEAQRRNEDYDKRTKHNLLNYLPWNNDFDV